MKTKFLLAVLLTFIFASNAYATNVIKLPLGTDIGADVIFDGTVFSTLDDGNPGTLGDQNTRILFQGFGGLFADINDDTASFSLENVLAAGAPVLAAGVIAQGTTGGVFSLWGPDNTLLISGTLADGALSGSSNSGTGSFFNTQLGNFTSGSLLSYLSGNTADLSLALNAVMSGTVAGMHITGNALDPFQTDASALIQGAEVPEPASAALLLTGLAVIGARRRRLLNEQAA